MLVLVVWCFHMRPWRLLLSCCMRHVAAPCTAGYSSSHLAECQPAVALRARTCNGIGHLHKMACNAATGCWYPVHCTVAICCVQQRQYGDEAGGNLTSHHAGGRDPLTRRPVPGEWGRQPRRSPRPAHHALLRASLQQPATAWPGMHACMRLASGIIGLSLTTTPLRVDPPSRVTPTCGKYGSAATAAGMRHKQLWQLAKLCWVV